MNVSNGTKRIKNRRIEDESKEIDNCKNMNNLNNISVVLFTIFR